MLNLLSKLRPALSGADAPAQLAALHSRREAANKEAAEAQAAFEDTVQRAVASECSWDDVAKAKAALTDAEGAAAALAEAVELAEKHQEAAQRAAAVDAAWAATVDACREREGIATRLQGRLEKVAADYAQLVALNAKVHRALPTGLPARDMENFSIAADLAPSLLRVEYSRSGLPGGPHLMGAEHQLLADRYKVATVCAERARAAAQGVDNG
jgi:predicted  nucleic acid-binding Zn-ribbon protein